MTFDFLYRTLQSWQQPESACISNCNCYTASVSPVCGSNGVTYLSACFAGCTKPVSWDNKYKYCRFTWYIIITLSPHFFLFVRTWPTVRVYPATAKKQWLYQESVPAQAVSKPSSPSCVLYVCAAWLELWPRHPLSSSLSGMSTSPPPLAIHQLLTRGSWRHFKIPVVLQWKGLIYQADSDTDKYRHTQVYINSYIMTNNTKGIICTLCVCVCIHHACNLDR